MKSAEEWSKEIDNCQEVCGVMQQHELEAHIKQIQLDAYKQGVTDAAEIARIESRGQANKAPQSRPQLTAQKIQLAILTARDNKTCV